MDSFQENKGGWIIAIGAFILVVLKTIGLIREKEEDDHEQEEKRIQEEIEKRIREEEIGIRGKDTSNKGEASGKEN